MGSYIGWGRLWQCNARCPLAHNANVAEGPPIPPPVPWVWRGDPTSAHDGPWCVVRATPILHTCAALCTEARASGASHQPFLLSHTRIRGWGRMRSVVVECGGRVLSCVGNVREKKQSERGVLSVV